MGQVTSLFVRKMLLQVADPQARYAFLTSVGMGAEEADPARMIAASTYYDLLERVVRSDPDGTTLPLRVGATMACDDYAAFGLAWKSALTLQGSYERAVRYARVLTSVTGYRLEKVDGGAILHLERRGQRRLGMRISNEATLASIFAISREVCGERFRAEAVCFGHAPPACLSGHRAYFGCEPVFNADWDGFRVSDDVLQATNRLGDRSISNFFEAHLAGELAQLQGDETLERRVRSLVTRSLSEGVPMVSDVARQLGMSGRTLQRRLADIGQTFQWQVDMSRRELAEQLLRETDYALTEVAFLTGFSEQSAFTRAFRRWSGQTPRSFRLASTSGRE
ncbi:MAG: AraC family transcriptional regulator ligand-binding domain-containing protein [Minwuia sp.]|nr:AraC family transcriptional regulator ligand-binding domain-containing protein [Minwuia sp.]